MLFVQFFIENIKIHNTLTVVMKLVIALFIPTEKHDMRVAENKNIDFIFVTKEKFVSSMNAIITQKFTFIFVLIQWSFR